jgi:phosphate transport system protein
MRHRYARQLQNVHDDLLRIGSRVEHGLADAMRALTTADAALAANVVAADREIDRTHVAIDEQIFELIAMQQPVASDLRTLLATSAIASELERAGDYAKGIAKRVSLLLNQTPIVPVPATVGRMGELAHGMLNECLDAYVKRDIAIARNLADTDALVDALEDEANEQIRAMIRGDVSTLNSGLILIEITYMLERLADRTTNIGERVIFMINSPPKSSTNNRPTPKGRARSHAARPAFWVCA